MKLAEIIHAAQMKDETMTEELLKRFLPLVKKYARILNYEDALNDIRLDLIELVTKINLDAISNTEDKFLLSYINTSVANAFTKRLRYKNKNAYTTFSDLSDKEFSGLEYSHATVNDHSSYFFREIISKLPDKHKRIMQLYFEEQLSIDEIAAKTGVSRQAVNQIKLRIISKLRDTLDAEGGIKSLC